MGELWFSTRSSRWAESKNNFTGWSLNNKSLFASLSVGGLLSALAVFVCVPTAVGHGHLPSWLDVASHDRGRHIAVYHTRVIRNRGPVNIRVSVRNVAGVADVVVSEIRYKSPPLGLAETHRFGAFLPTRRVQFELYKKALAGLEESADREDDDAVERLTRQCRDLLGVMGVEGVSDRFLVPADRVLGHVGSHVSITVEVDLIENGVHRVIERQVRIPIQPLLPDGAGPATSFRYDVLGETLLPRQAPYDVKAVGGGATWLAGDQHLHTVHSLDALALDGTEEDVADYAAVGELVGLNWIITTDHSNVHTEWFGTPYYTPEQFAAGAAQAAIYSAVNPLLALYSQEMGAGQDGFLNLPSHYLAYPFSSDSTGYMDNPSSGVLFELANCEPEQVIIDRVAAAGGFGFIAHPFESFGLTFATWDFDNGATGWSGLEIWSDADGQIQPNDDEAYVKWHELLNEIAAPVEGVLAERPGFPNAFPVGIGNSDAHEPRFIGATFTYARATELSRAAVTEALMMGRCVASNGPLLIAMINGAPIGEVGFLLDSDNDLELTLATSPEFGQTGLYQIRVLVNGVVRFTIPPTGVSGFSLNLLLGGMNLSPPDRFVTLRADSADGTYHALTNPIWLQFTTLGDANADTRVDAFDYAAWFDCISGSGVQRDPACDVMDFDRDNDVDLLDFASLQIAFTGP